MLNNFEKQTTIKVSGTYSKLTINEEDKNTLNSVQYRYRETDGEWNGWNNLVFSANEGKFTCTDMVLQLDNAKSFEFEIKASDNLSEATVEAEVGVGRGIFSISADGRIWLGDQEIPQIEIIEEWDEPD